jgi:molybdopterin synthase catalytic subunit
MTIKNGTDAHEPPSISIDLTALRIKPSDFARVAETDGIAASAAAELLFSGRVQPKSVMRDDAPVIGIDYEIPPLAFTHQVRQIILEVHRAIPEVSCVRIVHRTGYVAVGDATVIVLVRARHRASALNAMDIIVDRMKREAAVYKKEIFAMN